MITKDFTNTRKKLGRTQKELARLLGVSLKAIHSYEQGWRPIPAHIERQLYFLLSSKKGIPHNAIPCWERQKCNCKEQCPAWEFQCGHLCWFICGTLCQCAQATDVKKKLEICRECEILKSLLG